MVRKAVLSCALVAVLSTASFAAEATYTWSGLSGTSSLWSDAANWDALPVSDPMAHLIFGASSRMDPTLDLVTSTQRFVFNSMTFTGTAGTYALGGQTPYLADPGLQQVNTVLQFGKTATGPQPTITKTAGSGDITIHNPVTYNGTGVNATINVAGGKLTLDGGVWGSSYDNWTIKTGPGTLEVNQDGINVFSPLDQANAAANWTVNEGTLILGAKPATGATALKYWRSSGTPPVFSWSNYDATPVGGWKDLTVGDGIGGPAADICRLRDVTALRGLPDTTVNSSGWLDMNNIGMASTGKLTINRGLVTCGPTSGSTVTGTFYKQGGSLTFNGGGTLDAGTWTLSSGDRFYLYNSTTVTVNDDGAPGTTAIIKGTAMRFNSGAVTLTVNDITGADVDLDIQTIIDGTRGMIKAGPGVLQLSANNTYTSTTQINAGKVLVNGTNTGQGSFTVANGATLAGTGSIGLAAAASPNPAASLTVQGGGTLAPGGLAATGTMTVGRSTVADTITTLGDGGASLANLNIRIADAATADKLILIDSATSVIANNLILNGVNLNLSFLNGFTPANGASYTIVDNQAPATIVPTGTFANVTGGKVSITGGTFDVSYTGGDGNDVVLSNFAAAITLLPGDANRDGKVSFADYILLANNFGQTGATWDMGDFNGDGKVSFADYILLANNFGQHTPEPATLGLLLIGGLGLIRRNRK